MLLHEILVFNLQLEQRRIAVLRGCDKVCCETRHDSRRMPLEIDLQSHFWTALFYVWTQVFLRSPSHLRFHFFYSNAFVRTP